MRALRFQFTPRKLHQCRATFCINARVADRNFLTFLGKVNLVQPRNSFSLYLRCIWRIGWGKIKKSQWFHFLASLSRSPRAPWLVALFVPSIQVVSFLLLCYLSTDVYRIYRIVFCAFPLSILSRETNFVFYLVDFWKHSSLYDFYTSSVLP